MTATLTHSREVNDYIQSVTDLIPEENLLGSILFYSIVSADVNLDKARAELEALGLDTQYLRKRLRPVDAYHKACRDIERKFPVREDGVQSRFLVPSVGQDKETAHRHVVLERAHVSTGKKRQLIYDTVAEVIFWRGEINDEGRYENYRVEVNRKSLPFELSGQEKAWLESMLGGLVNRFKHYRTHLDSHAVRTYVRDYVTAMRATLVKKNGGLYFIPQKHSHTLESLRKWVLSINDECEFHTMPLIDLDDQREMLQAAYEDEVLGEVERLTGKISKILKDPSRNITEGTFEQMNEQVGELLSRNKEYAEMLDRKLSTAGNQVEMLQRQVLSLVDRVK